jgi:hypothetical protein
VTPIKTDDAVKFLREAARYFDNRPTGGEDSAFWSNVANAQTCHRIADLLHALPKPKDKPVRTYEVSVVGFPPVKYSARSPGKARSRAYRDFTGAFDSYKPFGEFMAMSTVRRIADPPGCGDRIVVAGETVTRVYSPYTSASGVYFMRDGSDAISSVHPSEIQSQAAGEAQ